MLQTDGVSVKKIEKNRDGKFGNLQLDHSANAGCMNCEREFSFPRMPLFISMD